MITKEEKDERLLSGGKIVFFIGVFLLFFYWIMPKVLSVIVTYTDITFIQEIILGYVILIIFAIVILIISILQVIYGVKLLKRGHKLWGFLNLLLFTIVSLWVTLGIFNIIDLYFY